MMSSKASGAIGGAAQGAAIGMQVGGPWGAAIGGVLGGIGGLLGGGGESEAKALAKLQADLIDRTSEENKRRMLAEANRGLGAIRAQVSASGLQFSGSSKRYYGEYEAEALRQIRWEETKAKLEAQTAIMGGQLAVDQIQSQGMSSMIGGITSAASSGLFGSYSKSTGYTPPGS